MNQLRKEIIEIEKTIQNLQNAENRVTELLSEVQVINNTAVETFDNTFTSVEQNQKSLGL